MTGVTNPQEGGVIGTALHPAQLFHVGIVCRDIDATMAEMSANLGLTWKGGRPALHDLVIDGEPRQIEMRIAHATAGPPHLELIEARPNTPWAEASAPHGLHHLCYWSQDAAQTCQRLEAAGNRRVLGKPGSAGGYFLTPTGLYIEIINPELHDHLSSWITR